MRSKTCVTQGFLARRRGGLAGIPLHPSPCTVPQPFKSALSSSGTGADRRFAVAELAWRRPRHRSLPGPARSGSAVTPSDALPSFIGSAEWAFPPVPSRPTPDHRAPLRGSTSRLQAPRHALRQVVVGNCSASGWCNNCTEKFVALHENSKKQKASFPGMPQNLTLLTGCWWPKQVVMESCAPE